MREFHRASSVACRETYRQKMAFRRTSLKENPFRATRGKCVPEYPVSPSQVEASPSSLSPDSSRTDKPGVVDPVFTGALTNWKTGVCLFVVLQVNNSVPLKTWAEDDFHFSNPDSGVSSSPPLTSTSQSRRHRPQLSTGHRYRHVSPPSSPSSSTSSSSSSTLSSPSPSFSSTSLPSHDNNTADPRGRDRKQPPSSSKACSLSSSKKSSYQRLPGQLCESIDVVVALGGDGTMLWVSRLFEESVPPVLGVSMGSLGYLTRFAIDEAREQLTEMAAREKFSVNLRCRLSKLMAVEAKRH